MKCVALIPSYEPDNKLIKVIDDLYKNKFKIVLVNDGSGKKYDKFFEKCKDKVDYLEYRPNHGKGYALKLGLKYILENYPDYVVVTMDSDGQHTTKDALNLCQIASKENGTIILGKRLRGEKTPIRSKVGNAITRFVYRLTTKIDIYDTQTGLRAFNTTLIPFMLDVEGDRFEYEMNILLYAPLNGIKLKEEVIETIYENNNGGSHFNAIKDSFKIYKRILKFASSSLISFFIDYGLYSVLSIFINNVILPNIIARIVSSNFNYFMNKKMVFNSSKKVKDSIFKYYLLVIFILIVNTSLLYAFVNILTVNKFVAKILIELILFIVSYFIQRKFIFKD